jgi:hypothetical protein
MVSGCGPFLHIQDAESVGQDVMARAAKIAVVDADQAAKMQSLGEVTGHSCKNMLWDPEATAEAATLQVKMFAAQRDATAIASLSCEEGSVSLLTNCWQSFECKATALK